MSIQQLLLEASALGLTPKFRCLLISQSCPVLPFIILSLQYSAYTEISLKAMYRESCACVYYC